MAISPLTSEAPETQPRQSVVELPFPNQDVRRKRPPLLSFLLRMDTLRRGGRVLTLVALDIAGVFLAILTALLVKAAIRDSADLDVAFQQTKDLVALATLVTLLLFARSGLYSDRGQRPGFTRIVGSLFQVTVVALLFAVINGDGFSSYYIFYGSLFFSLLYITAFRAIYEAVSGVILRAAGYRRRAVLVGSGKTIEAVAHALGDGHSPINVIGFISLTPRPDNGLRSLGRIEEIGSIIADHRLDEVIIADSDFPERQAVELVDQAHQQGVRVRIAPSTMDLLVQRAEFVPGETVPLFELKPPVFDGFDYLIKRTFDIVVSGALLLVLSPLLVSCWLAIRLTSRGPAIYRSSRPGIGGQPFDCLKFRTMHDDAEQRQEELEVHNEAGGAIFKIRQDPRVTRVGRLLRRWSLDELPQLFCVLRGQMSLVGPRPLPQRDFERLEDWHKKRYHVLPGMTGLWQVSGRSELDFDDLVRLDFLYLERWSVFLDLSILLKTLPAVLMRRGAF